MQLQRLSTARKRSIHLLADLLWCVRHEDGTVRVTGRHLASRTLQTCQEFGVYQGRLR